MTMRPFRLTCLPAALMLAGCAATGPAPSTGERPMDEVPVQSASANGERRYAFKNGCVIVLEPRRAVVKAEGAVCELHHRDIALLYASAD